jgi:GntR family transcriptional regulator, sialic acid-inducible nan operon repressor
MTGYRREHVGDLSDLIEHQPIERSRLSEEVSERLESLIASGRLRPGDKLPPERELMKLFGVGRPSIREALFALQRKGLISTSAGARPVVVSPRSATIVAELSGMVRYFLATEAGTREFQRARRLIEPAIARHAARAASDGEIAKIKAALDENLEALGDRERFADTDVAFHFAIVEATQSELLTAMHRAVFEWLRTQRTASIGPKGSAEAACAAHRRIYAAIARHDPDAAEAAMEKHLQEVERFYWAGPNARAASAAQGANAKPTRTSKGGRNAV